MSSERYAAKLIGGSARFFSPLGVYDFVKRTNVIALSEETLTQLAPSAAAIARFEGLPLHARSVLRESVTEKVTS